MVTQQLSGNLARAILNEDDPATVRAGAPAYLLFLDGILDDRPNDDELMIAAAQLYTAYAGIFVDDLERAQKMSAKARRYARRALCLRAPRICEVDGGPYGDFVAAVARLDRGDVPAIYTYGAAWAGWIQAHINGWNALADVPKVEALMDRVVQLDETYDHGQAHLYLGVMRSQIPPAAGGDPERGRRHFERAIELSNGQNLIVKVEFARNYARLMFDRELHDRLLNEVLEADPTAPDLTLSNVLAQQEARELLATSAQYFEE